MQRASSTSAFAKSVRFQFAALSVIFLLAFSTFYLAWGQMRYSSTTIIPMEKLVYWRFAMAGWLPFVAYIVTGMFVAAVMMSVTTGKMKRLSLISWIHIAVCGLALVWTLMFCAWEITAWTECNDPGPKHPECRNRQYPDETIADYSFIMMVVSAAVMACLMGWALYMNSMIGITRLGLEVAARADVEYTGERIQSRYGHSGKKKMSHNFMYSQGNE